MTKSDNKDFEEQCTMYIDKKSLPIKYFKDFPSFDLETGLGKLEVKYKINGKQNTKTVVFIKDSEINETYAYYKDSGKPKSKYKFLANVGKADEGSFHLFSGKTGKPGYGYDKSVYLKKSDLKNLGVLQIIEEIFEQKQFKPASKEDLVWQRWHPLNEELTEFRTLNPNTQTIVEKGEENMKKEKQNIIAEENVKQNVVVEGTEVQEAAEVEQVETPVNETQTEETEIVEEASEENEQGVVTDVPPVGDAETAEVVESEQQPEIVEGTEVQEAAEVEQAETPVNETQPEPVQDNRKLSDRIKSINVEDGSRDGIVAHLYVGKHPAKPGRESLYYFTDDKRDKIDWANPEKSILSQEVGGKIVSYAELKLGIHHDVPGKLNKGTSNKIKLVCYDKKSNKPSTALITKDGSKDVVDFLDKNNMFHKVKSKEKNIAITLISAAISIVISMSAVMGFGFAGDQTKQAGEFGLSEANARVESVLQNKSTLFKYEQGKLVGTRGLHEILVGKGKATYVRSKSGLGFLISDSKYQNATMEKFGLELGSRAATELASHRDIALMLKEEGQDAVVLFKYPATPGADVGALSSREAFVAYLTANGYSSKEANALVKNYEKGFSAVVKDLETSKGGVTIIDGNGNSSNPGTVTDSTEYNDIIKNVVGNNDVETFYMNYDEGVVFTVDQINGKLYRVDMEESDNKLEERIEKASGITEAVEAGKYFENLSCGKALENYKAKYKKDNKCSGVAVYISGVENWEQDGNEYKMEPTVYLVKLDVNNNATAVEARKLGKVTIAKSDFSKVRRDLATAVLMLDGIRDEDCLISIDKKSDSNIFEENKMDSTGVKFDANNETEKDPDEVAPISIKNQERDL